MLIYDISIAHTAPMSHSWESIAEFQWDFLTVSMENELTLSHGIYTFRGSTAASSNFSCIIKSISKHGIILTLSGKLKFHSRSRCEDSLCPAQQSLITGSQQTAFQNHLYPHTLSNTLACIFYIAKGSAPLQTKLQKGCRLIHMSEFTGVLKNPNF